MELQLSPEIEAQLKRLASVRGCKPEEIIEDWVADCVEQAATAFATLDRRYDDMITGKVKMLSPEEFWGQFEERKAEWLAKRG